MEGRAVGADASEEDIATLAGMGFDRSLCEAAYAQTRGNGGARLQTAADILLNGRVEAAQLPSRVGDSRPRTLADAHADPAPALPADDSDDDLPPPPPRGPAPPPRPGAERLEPMDALRAENAQLKAENATLKQEVAELRQQLRLAHAAQNVPHEQVPPDHPVGAKLQLGPGTASGPELEPEPELLEPEPEAEYALTRTTTPQAIAKLQTLSPALRENAIAQLVDRQAEGSEAGAQTSVERFAAEERSDEELQRPAADSQELERLLLELGIRSEFVVSTLRGLGYVRVGDLRRADDMHGELQTLLELPDRRRLEKALANPREFPATHRAVSDAASEGPYRLAEVPLRSFLSGVDLQHYSERLEELGYRFLSDLLEALVDASVAEWRRSCKDKLDSLADLGRQQRVWSQAANAEQAQSCHVWQYEGDPGEGWMDMRMEQQLELTSKYLQRIPTFEVPPYTFDFTKMTQTRADTKTVRKIQGATEVGKLQNLPEKLRWSIDRALAVFHTDVERDKLIRAVEEHAMAPIVAASDSDAALRSSASSTPLILLDKCGKPKHKKEPRYFRLTRQGQVQWAKTEKKAGKSAQVVGVSRSASSLAFIIHKVDLTGRAPGLDVSTLVASDLHVVAPDVVVRREWLFALAAVSHGAQKAEIGAESGSSSPRQSLSPIPATTSPTQSPKDAKRTEQALAALAETVADIAAGTADAKTLTRRMVESYQHSPSLVAKTCEALCQRSAADRGGAKLTADGKAFVKANGPDAVVRACGVHAADAEVQKYGVALLKSIKCDPSVDKAIKAHGAAAAAAVAGALSSGGADLAAAGSHTLQFLAKRPFPRVRDSIAEVRGIVALAKVLADYPEDKDVQRAGCRALRHMCSSEGHKSDDNAQAVLHENAHALAKVAQQQVKFQDDERLLKAARELIFRVPGKPLPRETTSEHLIFPVELTKLDGSPENSKAKPKACRVYIGERSISFYARDSNKKLIRPVQEIMYIDINLDRAEGSRTNSDVLTLKTKEGGVDAAAFRLNTPEADTILQAICAYHSDMTGEQRRTKEDRIAKIKRAEDIAAQTRRDIRETERRIETNTRAELQEQRRAAEERQRAEAERKRRADADVKRERDEQMRIRAEQQRVQMRTSKARDQALLSEQKATELAAQQEAKAAKAREAAELEWAKELEAEEAEHRRRSQEWEQQRIRADMAAEEQSLKASLDVDQALVQQEQMRARQLEIATKKKRERAKADQAQAAHDRAVMEHRDVLVQMQQHIPVWQYQGDRGWVNYDGPDNIRITDAYKAQTQRVAVGKTHAATWWYELDLTRLVQCRTDLKTERAIRGVLGGGRAVPPVIMPQIDVPYYWTHKVPGSSAQIPSEFGRQKLQQLMIGSTYHGHKSGCGAGRPMRRLQVTRCLRVENMKLWRSYCFHRESLRETAAASGHGFSPLAQRPEPAKFLTEQNGRVIDGSLNEFYLWHGTKPETVETLAQHGFDARLANLGGLYGAGNYFADAACKSNQYARDANSDGEHAMLYCRVLMGEAFMTDRLHNDERRPPDNPSTPGQPYDSIFAEQGVGNHGKQQHNEYVVFHGQQCYPEYIVWYTTS